MDLQITDEIRWQLSKKDNNGNTPLLYAVLGGCLDTVKFLLELGSAIDEPNNKGETALHIACKRGHADVVELLLERGASLDAEDDTRSTPWHQAAANRHSSILAILAQQRSRPSQSEKPEDKIFIAEKLSGDVKEAKDVEKSVTDDKTEFIKTPKGRKKRKGPKTPQKDNEQALGSDNTAKEEDVAKAPFEKNEKAIEETEKKTKEGEAAKGVKTKKKGKKTPEKKGDVDAEIVDRTPKKKDSSKDDLEKGKTEKTPQKEEEKQKRSPKSDTKKCTSRKTPEKEGRKEIKLDEVEEPSTDLMEVKEIPRPLESTSGKGSEHYTKDVEKPDTVVKTELTKTPKGKKKKKSKTPQKKDDQAVEIPEKTAKEEDVAKTPVEKDEKDKEETEKKTKENAACEDDVIKEESKKASEKKDELDTETTDRILSKKDSSKGNTKKENTEKTPQKEDGKLKETPKSETKKGKSGKTPEKEVRKQIKFDDKEIAPEKEDDKNDVIVGEDSKAKSVRTYSRKKEKVKPKAEEVYECEDQEEEAPVHKKRQKGYNDELKAYYAAKRKAEEASKVSDKPKFKFSPKGDKKKEDKSVKTPEKGDDEKAEISKSAKTPEKKDVVTTKKILVSSKTPEKNNYDETTRKNPKSTKSPEQKDDKETKACKELDAPVAGTSITKKSEEASKDKDEGKGISRKKIKRGGRKHKNRERAEDRKSKKAKRYEDSSLSLEHRHTSDSDFSDLPEDEEEDYTIYLSHFPNYEDKKSPAEKKMSSGYFDEIDSKIVDVRKKDQKGFTILHIAIKYGRLAAVKRLIECGADVNELTNIGFSPVMIAALGGYGDIIEVLVDEGADLKLAHRDTGLTALHYAVFHGYLDAIAVLLSRGADPNAKDISGNTPLHFAVTDDDYLPIVKYLVQHGADPNMENSDHVTPYDLIKDESIVGIRQYLTMLRESKL